MQAILYDIFLLPAASHIISDLLEQGKLQASKITLHKHSLGVSPIFVLGSLLLLATTQNLRVTDSRYKYNLDPNSRGILQQLRQVAKTYDRATQTLALTFSFGHHYHILHPAALAVIKQMGASPWPLLLDEPAAPTLLQTRIAAARCRQQNQQ